MRYGNIIVTRANLWQPQLINRFFGILTFALCTLVFQASPAVAQQAVPTVPVIAPLVDHHIHLGSPALSDYLEKIDKADPTAFKFLSRDIFSRPTLSDALRLLDEAGVKRAVLLSSAYLFMTGESPDSPEAAQYMQRENQFTVDAALASQGRLIAFIAINPFAPNAETELAYWKDKRGVGGIKLHLGAAGFQAGSPDQMTRLAKFFDAARKARLPIVVHLRGAATFAKSDVEIFIRQVLSQAGKLPVQIAHGGGYAGADPATIDSLTAFGEAIARKAPGTRNLVFDISGVALPEETASALGSSDAQLQKFVDLMRRIGLKKFVLGSDWPATGNIAAYYSLMKQKLPLTNPEWTQLCKNRAPYVRNIR
jgi:predicted TIM-barrel fold metal-dependent hydrolase